MARKQLNLVLLTLISILLFISDNRAQQIHEKKHIEVSLRMIGHQVLLNSGDSTSRVLPIIEKNGQYRIELESAFAINPEELVLTVNRLVKETSIAKSYIVEVEDCETKEVVYSYEMNDLEQSNIIPCITRNLPKSCYSLIFTLAQKDLLLTKLDSVDSSFSLDQKKDKSQFKFSLYALLLLFLFLTFSYLWKRNSKKTSDPNLITLGEYQFDKLNSELIVEDERIELTSKEADLLILLYNGVNTTIEREVILKRVWGDEGDYVGRTLDVFISKLRKKLGADPKVKIVNIRGIGYKLVMDI